MTGTATDAVELTAAGLGIDEVLRIARGAAVTLGRDAVTLIGQSRAIVDAAVDGPELVYGLNTGLGHMRNSRVPRDVLSGYQELMVLMHEGAVGPPLPTTLVRAAMAVRLAGIARGGSGIGLGATEALVGMLNGGVTPVVPTIGSVGAADLMHMSSIAQVLIGHGHAEYGGEMLPGAEALARAGLAPVTLEPKDGLALISANGISIGHAALVVERARRLAGVADLVLASSLEIMSGNPSIVDPAVLAAKPVAGQAAAGESIRAFLDGSELFTPGVPASVQDPLSFRVAPQVHGAYREFVTLLESAVEAELRAMDDNPLVDLESGRLISNGNFHPMAMALALDALRPAIAHVGMLSDRRMNHLWAAVSDIFLDEEPMREAVERGDALLRYTAAARVSELRLAADPATLDVGALDMAVEDHATNAPLAARRTDEALGLLEEVLAIELLDGQTVLWLRPTGRPMPPALAAAFEVVQRVRARLDPRPTAATLHAAVVAVLVSEVLDAAERAARGS